MLKCHLCDYTHETLISADHIRINHGMGTKQYLTMFPNAQLRRTVHTAETRARISAKKAGAPAWNKGVPMGEEQKKAHGEFMRDYYATHKHPRSGVQLTDETKEKISSALTGVKYTDERRENFCRAMRALVASDGYVNSMAGKKHTEETKAKLSKVSQTSKYKVRAEMERQGRWVPLEQLDPWEIYKREVGRVTERNVHLIDGYDESLRGLACHGSNNYHVDHKYSRADGFKNGVPPEIIGHVANLRFIPWTENLLKSSESSITLEELLSATRGEL